MQNVSNKIIEDAYLKPIDEVLKTVFVDPDEGLSDKVIRKKIQIYGKKKPEEQSKGSIWDLVFAQNTKNHIFATIGLAIKPSFYSEGSLAKKCIHSFKPPSPGSLLPFLKIDFRRTKY